MTTPEATALEELLTDRIGEAPHVPGDSNLGSSIEAFAYWSKQPSIEIVLARSEEEPSDAAARGAHKHRLNKRPIPLVLIISWPGGDVVVGAGGDPVPVARIDAQLIVGDLASVIGHDPLDVPIALANAIQQAHGTGALTGLRNHGLFSSHLLERRAAQYGEWDDMQSVGAAARKARTLDGRLAALGFEADKRKDNVFLLSSESRPAAAIFAFSTGADLDRVMSDGDLPVTELLREMQATRVKWGILCAGDVWRLHYADGTSPADSYVEIALDKLSASAYFGLLFSAAALSDDGLASRVLEDSQEFATGLGTRLRDRIYGHVVPILVETIAIGAEREGHTFETRDEYRVIYDATLTLLYRLLFILYAESRRYLPVDTNNLYKTHSLGTIIEQQRVALAEGRELSASSHSVWTDLMQVFDAIASGNDDWGVPAYNGGLFATGGDDPHLKLLDEIKLGNAGLVDALIHLAVDDDGDETGRVDFSDLDIRRLGDIYEGLLSFEVDCAPEDLTLDQKVDVFRPTQDGESVDVSAGAIYVRTRGGGRKASGSFYTPQFIVRHLVEQALVPALDDHLANVSRLIVEGKTDLAEQRLWEFRVVDPAMGSGHFLVDALDVITTHIARWLGENPLPPLRSTLEQLREVVVRTMRDAGGYERDQIKDVELLRRVVLKRCIYGVDHNYMAVQLARLALWLDAFVPGLPLSYLDHNLQHGNSLIGVVGDEVIDSITEEMGGSMSLFAGAVTNAIDSALKEASDAFSRVERSLDDVHDVQGGFGMLRTKLDGLYALYDAWTSESFDNAGARKAITQITTGDALATTASLSTTIGGERVAAARTASEQHSFFHWPLAFPEVFRGERPGFDVVLANPPWEKIKPEKLTYYAIYTPGLKGIKDSAERDRIIADMDISGSPAAGAFADAQEDYEQIKRYFSGAGGNYHLGGSGDIDLFKGFAERFLHISRARGAVGVVLPRQLISGKGSERLRVEYIGANEVVGIDVLENKARWAFANVDPRYTIVLVAIRRNIPDVDHAKVSVAGPLTSRQQFTTVAELRVPWSLAGIRAWSATLDVPMLPDQRSGDIFGKLLEHPGFGSTVQDSWRAIPYVELHDTYDRPGLFLDESTETAIEIWKGANFDIYQPCLGCPPFYAELEALERRLQEKRLRSRKTWSAFSNDFLEDPSTLPIHGPRIAFRDVTRATDSRTMRSALLPPGVGLLMTAPFLIWSAGNESDMSYVLGVFCSIPFDWAARRRVEAHMKYGILNSLPVPRAPTHWKRIAANAARLSCIDDRYSGFARNVGVEYGPLESTEAERLKAENDALVAHAYGLTRSDLEFIFTDFTDRAAPPPYRDHVLALYDEWSSK